MEEHLKLVVFWKYHELQWYHSDLIERYEMNLIKNEYKAIMLHIFDKLMENTIILQSKIHAYYLLYDMNMNGKDSASFYPLLSSHIHQFNLGNVWWLNSSMEKICNATLGISSYWFADYYEKRHEIKKSLIS